MSLNVSAIFPGTPVQKPGRRTEKSPSRMVWRAARIEVKSTDSRCSAASAVPFSPPGGSVVAVRVLRVLFIVVVLLDAAESHTHVRTCLAHPANCAFRNPKIQPFAGRLDE